LEDMVSVVGQTFLGLTVNCARCHDHKFDPIPQRDYYAMKSALSGARHGNRSLWTPEEQKNHAEAPRDLQTAVKELESRNAALYERARKRIHDEPGTLLADDTRGHSPKPI